MKKVRTNECRLCMAEKCEIVTGKMKGVKLLNENFEIYGPCKHRTRFHRFRSTDEHQARCEKSPGTKEVQNMGKRDSETGEGENVGDIVLCRVISS